MAERTPGLRPPGLGPDRPDNSVGFAGGDGNLMLQDGAKAVFRGGVTSETGDFDVFQADLVESDVVIPLDDVGGASLINAGIISLGDSGEPAFDSDPSENPTNASRAFTVTIEDLAKGADPADPDEEDVLLRRQPDALTSTEQGRLGAGIFSDTGRVVISHAGLGVGENLINASVNIQSGSTDAVQLRGADGTLTDPASPEDFEALGDAISEGLDALASSRTTFETGVAVGDAASGGDELARLDTRSSSTVSINIDAEGAIDVQYQTSPNGISWFEDVTTLNATKDQDLQGIESLRDELETGSRYVRVVLDTPASGDVTADVALEASG